MNVIFLDFDGVLSTASDSYNSLKCYKILRKRIAILAEICKEYNCKIVIEASAKNAIDEETMEISKNAHWVNLIMSLFKEYGIECIGRTPNVRIDKSNGTYIDMWKEDEIILYLKNHPEIEHYCVIDDDDTVTMLHWEKSDLDKVRDHLVIPLYYSNNPEEEGLLPKHKEEVGRILEKENEIRKLVLRKNEGC